MKRFKIRIIAFILAALLPFSMAAGMEEMEVVDVEVAVEESGGSTGGAAAYDASALVALAGQDGAKAAQSLNGLGDEEFYEALRAILNYYYSTDAAGLDAFLNGLDERGRAIAKSYEDARIERESVDLDYIPGQVVVVFNEDVPFEIMQQAADETDAPYVKVVETALPGTVAEMGVSMEYTVERAIEEIESDPMVAYAQPNYIYHKYEEEEPYVETQSTPNDSYYYAQWYFDKIRAGDAWDIISKMGRRDKVRVAVLDGAADIYHSDLRQNVNASLARDTSRGYISSYPGYGFDEHGTHVASTIASTANNNLGIAGVASGSSNQIVEVVPINVFIGEEASSLAVAAGLNWAMQTGCRVANLSLGTKYYDQVQKTAVDIAADQNLVCVCAGGNDNTNAASYPADFESTVGVIATDDYYSASSMCKSSFSNYGAAKNISAPGKNIYAGTTYSGYGYMSGTSMAAPVVSAAAAMTIYARPSLSERDVKNILYQTATDLYTKGFDVYTGWGNVNAAAAVGRVALTAPKNLKASPAGYDSIKISWTGVSGASGYYVYRSVSKDGS